MRRLGAVVTGAMMVFAGSTSSTAPSLRTTTTISTTAASTVSNPQSTVKVVARLPKQFSFASAPVLTSGGSEALALLEPSKAGFGGSPLRLASIELQTGRVTVGPVVAGNTATLFTGSGQVFLFNLFGTPIGHVELWRVPSDLKPVLLARLPFTEKTTTIAEFGPTNPAIADALVPGKDQAWIAVGNHILLVSLAALCVNLQ
jgi:hypothetical protein